MRICAVLLIILFIVGCQTTRKNPYEVAYNKAGKIGKECHDKRRRGELPNFVAAMRCGAGRRRAVIKASGNPHMDLIDLMFAYEMRLAEMRDSGEISAAEAGLKQAEFTVKITNAIRGREAVSRGGGRQQNSLQRLGRTLQKLSDDMKQRESYQRPLPPTIQPQQNCRSRMMGGYWTTNCN
jgi:hypothetical protein